MNCDWQDVRILDLGRVVTGRTPPGNAPDYYGDEVPFLTPSDMGSVRKVDHTARSLSSFGAQQLGRCLVPHGVGVSCIGWQMGKAVLIARPTITNQQINSVVINDEVADSLFVYYALRLRRSELFNFGSGGSRTPILNKRDFERLPFLLPPLHEQRAIASILGAFDDKIELNRRMNETLEELGRTIFRSWFVDFDPVRAKAEGKKPEGMDDETAALFPSRFVGAELGEIPEGWERLALAEASAELQRGIGPKYVVEGGVLVLNQKCVRDHRVHFQLGRRHDAAKGRSVKGRELQLGDVLVNSTGVGTLGRVAQITHLPEPAIVDSHLTVVRANQDSVLAIVLGVGLLQRESEIEALGEGSTGQTELSRKRLGELPFVVPAMPIQKRFESAVGPTRDRMDLAERESGTLAALRDLLLPKLISGELRIPEAEKHAEACL